MPSESIGYLNIHVHKLFLDGVYSFDEAAQTVFRQVPQPGPQVLQTLVEHIAERVGRARVEAGNLA